jgi:predicted nuclease of restriction endonuclease-like RecB superfamily
MLTAEHIDARRKDGELVLSRLDARARSEALALAEAYLDAARAQVGRTREELYEAWEPIATAARKRKLALGLKKLVDDACAFDADAALDPVELRRAVFERATVRRRARTEARPFDRASVVAEVAASMGQTADALEAALFSDLRGEHALRAAPSLDAASLVAAYELGRAQAVLLRAVRITCTITRISPGPLRAFFARLKFQQLLFTVTRADDATLVVTIDGPFSMFASVTRYGLRLALALPALRALDAWSLVADVRWGRAREALLFRLSSADVGEQPVGDGAPHVTSEVGALLDGLGALSGAGSPWTAELASALLDHPGLGVCVPDLVLRHRDGGAPIYVEVLGFWSRDAVWRRIELAQQGLGARVVFCASARLRVSPELLADDAPAALYVFRGKPSARALLERVERVASAPSAAIPYPPRS